MSVERARRLRALWSTLPYGVRLPDGRQVDVHVGAVAADVDAALPGSCAAWAYVSADNPLGARATDEANAAARARLRGWLAERGLPFLEASGGRGADPSWPPEPSVVVGGLDLVEAHALARRFGQAAFLYARRGAPVALVDVVDAAFDAARALETVAWVHVDDEDRCLMARPRGKPLFFMPGGKKEPGEDDATALARELREELGVTLDCKTLVARFVIEEQAFGPREPTVVRMACYGGSVSGIAAACAEIEELGWMGATDDQRVPPAGRAVLRRLREARRHDNERP